MNLERVSENPSAISAVRYVFCWRSLCSSNHLSFADGWYEVGFRDTCLACNDSCTPSNRRPVKSVAREMVVVTRHKVPFTHAAVDLGFDSTPRQISSPGSDQLGADLLRVLMRHSILSLTSPILIAQNFIRSRHADKRFSVSMQNYWQSFQESTNWDGEVSRSVMSWKRTKGKSVRLRSDFCPEHHFLEYFLLWSEWVRRKESSALICWIQLLITSLE